MEHRFHNLHNYRRTKVYYQPRRWRKERQEQQVFLSMVAFFNGDFKVVVHRDPTLENSYEHNTRQVAWLTQEKNADYNDSPMVDQLKLSKAQYTWETNVPKPGERVEPTTEVDIIPKRIKIHTSLLYLSFVINRSPLFRSMLKGATTMEARRRLRAKNLMTKLNTAVYHQHQRQKSTEGCLQVMRKFKYHL